MKLASHYSAEAQSDWRGVILDSFDFAGPEVFDIEWLLDRLERRGEGSV